MTWGYATPDADEEAQEWPRFQTAADTPVSVTGDPDWGKAQIGFGVSALSNVLDLGDSSTRTFTLIDHKYGTGDSPSLYIRGSASSFAQHDGTPSWDAYSAPVSRAWRYVQVRLDP